MKMKNVQKRIGNLGTGRVSAVLSRERCFIQDTGVADERRVLRQFKMFPGQYSG
jgi:hypothetical protein